MKVDKERAEKEANDLLNADLVRNRLVLEEKFITDIIEDNFIDIDEIMKGAKALKLDLIRRPFRLICSYIDNHEAVSKQIDIKGNLLKLSVMNIAKDILSSEHRLVSFPYGSNTVITLYWDELINTTMDQKIVYTLKEFHKAVKDSIGINMSSCIIEGHKNYHDIENALEEASLMRKSYFYKGSGEVITTPISFIGIKNEDQINQYVKDFEFSIENENHTMTINCLSNLYEAIENHSYEPEDVKKLFLNLLLKMQFHSDLDASIVQNYRINTDSFESLKAIFSNILDNYIASFENKRIVSSRKEINIVLDYIENNLHKKISCSDMADLVHMNCSYFSRLFKSEVGLSFTDYMIDERVKKATYLLKRTDLPIEEITKEVGLEQASYFYKLYKRVTGKTPGEVRDI